MKANSGKESIEKARNFLPDLIIADILTPNMNGNQLMKKLRATDFGRKVPFIILMARKQMKDYFEVVEVEDFITKPFEAKQLMERIENALRRSKAKIS